MADQTIPTTHIGPRPPHDGREWDCQCARCGSSMDWRECEVCGGAGVDGHDCGEDCCMCADPEPNVRCAYCLGRGGWWTCMSTESYCGTNPKPGREQVERSTPEWFVVDERSDDAD